VAGRLLKISHRFRSGTEPTKFRFSATVIWRCFQPPPWCMPWGKKARPLASSRAGFRGHGPALGVGASWRNTGDRL
jgi:hypothetical protein